MRADAWFAPAFAIVAAVTLLRWLLLGFDNTDLYVDESQYWLWGQEFAFGYYSKPPLIGWMIEAVTSVAGSDDKFWVRMPGAALHGVTALILAAWASRMWGRREAILVAAAYVTLPMVAVGSLLISTDTVMAPFFAAALLFHHRLHEGGRQAGRTAGFALLTGAAIGLAFMAKYAAIYFLIGAGLIALHPHYRMGWRSAGLMLLAFAVVISPNIYWNLSNSLTTFSHTVDNVGWVREDSPLSQINLASGAAFLLSQFAVAGPVIFGALLLALRNPLAAFVVPPIAVVTVQALLGTAQANWAVAAYFTGVLLAVRLIAARPIWIAASFLANAVFCIALPLAVIFTSFVLPQYSDGPLISRQLGREAMSQQILAVSKAEGSLPIYADNRDVLADLFYTGRDAGVAIYAPRPVGRSQNHYEQRYPLPQGLTGRLVVVSETPTDCAISTHQLDLTGGTYRRSRFTAYVVEADCFAN